MAQQDYPADPAIWSAFQAHPEMQAFAQAHLLRAPGAIRTYPPRIRICRRTSWYCWKTGMMDAQARAGCGPYKPWAGATDGRIVLLHSGIVYSSGAIRRSCYRNEPVEDSLRVVRWLRLLLRLRATGNDERMQAMIAEASIADMVELAPAIPYADALAEMLAVDGLLVLQAASCNDQIPLRVYRCLRAQAAAGADRSGQRYRRRDPAIPASTPLFPGQQRRNFRPTGRFPSGNQARQCTAGAAANGAGCLDVAARRSSRICWIWPAAG